VRQREGVTEKFLFDPPIIIPMKRDPGSSLGESPKFITVPLQIWGGDGSGELRPEKTLH